MDRDREPDTAATPGWPNWLGLIAEDLEAQRRFYGEVLGLAEMDAGDHWVQFDLGEGKLFELLRRDDSPQYDRVRFQPGFAVGDIALARERLIALGSPPITKIEGGPEHGGYWCYFRDPEGNVFEISQSIPPARDPSTVPRAGLQ